MRVGCLFVLFKPIPRAILSDTVTLKQESDSDDGYAGNGTSTLTTIKNVYFEPDHKVIKTNTNEEKLIQGILFIDRINSKPFIVPQTDDAVFYGDDTEQPLRVESVSVIKALHGVIHHLEVTLT